MVSLEETLISRGKNTYLVHMFRTTMDSHFTILCYREDPLGGLTITINNKVRTFILLRYIKVYEYTSDQKLAAYVQYNRLVSMFREHKVYDES
jgi:hypothetical protein